MFIALSQRWGNVERPFLWKVVLCFLYILFRFHIFFCNWKWEIYSIIRCIYFFFTGLIIHGIHLCLRAPASTDQSLVGGKCGGAARCRSNSITKSFGEEEEWGRPQDGFLLLYTVIDELWTKPSAITTGFKACISWMLDSTYTTGEPSLEDHFNVPLKAGSVKSDFHLVDFVPGPFLIRPKSTLAE